MANDAYCQRYNKITARFKDLTYCVDDTLLWDKMIKENFFKTCMYLSTCSLNGIMFNLKKFQFWQEEVDFVGVQLTCDGMRLSQEMLVN